MAVALWLPFLTSGMVTIFLSPVTFRSALIAQNEMGDGFAYWVTYEPLLQMLLH